MTTYSKDEHFFSHAEGGGGGGSDKGEKQRNYENIAYNTIMLLILAYPSNPDLLYSRTLWQGKNLRLWKHIYLLINCVNTVSDNKWKFILHNIFEKMSVIFINTVYQTEK